MRELDTIQKQQKLNSIWAVDEKSNGGAHHRYIICKNGETFWQSGNDSTYVYDDVFFQKGARNVDSSQHGVIDGDLLEIVRDRLTCFQSGDFASEYNQHALEHVEEALKWLNKRVEDRIARNVLGKNEK